MKGLSKKGQVQAIAPSILALVFAAVALILGLVIIGSILSTEVITKAETRQVQSENITINYTGVSLTGGASSCARNSFSIQWIYGNTTMHSNKTTGIAAANYTINSTGATITLTTAGLEDTALNNTVVNVNYTYMYGDEACKQGNTTLIGLATFADFWEIIVLAIVISVVIGLLLIVFGGRTQR